MGSGYSRHAKGAQERCRKKMQARCLLKTHGEKFRWVERGGKALMAGWLRSFQLSSCRPAGGANAFGLGARARGGHGSSLDLENAICALLSVGWMESCAGFLRCSPAIRRGTTGRMARLGGRITGQNPFKPSRESPGGGWRSFRALTGRICQISTEISG